MTRRTTGEFTKDMLAETWEAILILACHSVVVAVVLLLTKGVELLEHALRDAHAEVTPGQLAIEYGLRAAEIVVAYGLLALGVVSALSTFAQRRREGE